MNQNLRDIYPGVAVAAAADYNSEIFALTGGQKFAFHLKWDGTLAGTFLLYQSLHPNPNPSGDPSLATSDWAPVTTDEVDFTGLNPAGAPGKAFINVGNAVGANKYMLVYTHTGGAGTILYGYVISSINRG